MIKYLKRKLYVKKVTIKLIIKEKKMSEEKQSEKMLLRGSAKKVEFDNGGHLLNVSYNIPQLVEVWEWYNKERKSRGLDETDYLNITIKERRNLDDTGNTHYSQFEPWFPQPKSNKKAESGGLPF
jgi:endo-1,4-beta-D-glucanase Y